VRGGRTPKKKPEMRNRMRAASVIQMACRRNRVRLESLG